jgi:hypothetical protein
LSPKKIDPKAAAQAGSKKPATARRKKPMSKAVKPTASAKK